MTSDTAWTTWLHTLLAEACRRLDCDPTGQPAYGLHGRTISTCAHTTSGPVRVRVVTEQTAWAGGPAWTGNQDANQLHGIDKPELLTAVEWDDPGYGRRVRGELMTLAPSPAISDSIALRHDPGLPAAWWSSLDGDLERLAGQPTARVCLEPEHLRLRILAAFGHDIDPAAIEWTTAHGDLHWANLTAPTLWLLDWEAWGTAPAGYDIATLYCTSLPAPKVAAEIAARFAGTLDTASGVVAQLAAAAKLLRLVEHGEHTDLAPLLHQHARQLTGHTRAAAR